VLDRVAKIAEEFAADRHARQRRRELDAADFARLAETGFLATGVSAQHGGLFESVAESTRGVAEIVRSLGRGDASVALVSAMHSAVLSFWLSTPEAPHPFTDVWAKQRREVGARAMDGAWFGTITSEPGSGGDIARTTARANQVEPDSWEISGQKHFGSGSGITSFMLTSARPEGEEAPDWFLLDIRGVPWDGSRGVTMTAEWDGHGMIATQSHGMLFERYPAQRFAWPGKWQAIADAAGSFVGTVFTAVILGIVDVAMDTARRALGNRAGQLGAYEQMEWAHAEQDAWLVEQAYEGMLRAVESTPSPLRTVVLGKTAAADLAESCLRRITRIMGGGSYARHSPYGFWFEDVRALGWLRPPWNLAHAALIESAWPTSEP
jgi:alkylation response protein AidB-like acyl-CoA dehydrogenase